MDNSKVTYQNYSTDDERIVDVCNQYGMNVVLTSPDGVCLIERLHELPVRFVYDYYVSINGDEPLIESEIIHFVLPDYVEKDKPLARGLMSEFTDPVEVIDPTNMKIVCNERGKLLFIS